MATHDLSDVRLKGHGVRPPGPRPRRLSGSMPELRRDILGFFVDCAREYGDVCGFRLYYMGCALVNHPDLIQEVLVALDDRMIKSWDVRRLKLALGDGLLTSEGEVWRRQRRLVQPAFHSERIRAYVKIMTGRAEAVEWQDGEIIDLHAEMMRLTLRIVAEALFGLDVTPHISAVDRAVTLFMNSFEAMIAGHVPPPLQPLTPARMRSRLAIRRLDRIIYHFARERRASGTEGRDDLISWLLSAQDEKGGRLTDLEVRDQVMTLLLAGHDTTAIALSWTFYLLAQHEDVESRLLAELEKVLGGRVPDAGDLPLLAFTRGVVQESMRLYPPAWGLGREPLEDVEIGGYRFRRGTQIFMVPYVTHRDARFFPEPERFLPERWSEEGEPQIPKFAYFPFGAGPRKCIGSNFAMMEATVLLAALIQRYHIQLVPDHPIELQPAVTLRPRHGIRVVVKRRD